MFSIGEHVQLVTPGWVWDGKRGTVVGAWPQMGRGVEPFYVVLVHWPGGQDRRYSVWHSELRAAPTKRQRKGGKRA